MTTARTTMPDDDHGSRRDDGTATSTATGDNGESRGTPTTTAAQSAARPVRSMFLARLAGAIDFLHAKGKAKLVSSSGASQLEIEIENIGRLAGTRVDFFVDGRKVGSDTVSSLGIAEVRVTGPGSISPAGKRVTVQTSAGLLIAAGNFE